MWVQLLPSPPLPPLLRPLHDGHVHARLAAEGQRARLVLLPLLPPLLLLLLLLLPPLLLLLLLPPPLLLLLLLPPPLLLLLLLPLLLLPPLPPLPLPPLWRFLRPPSLHPPLPAGSSAASSSPWTRCRRPFSAIPSPTSPVSRPMGGVAPRCARPGARSCWSDRIAWRHPCARRTPADHTWSFTAFMRNEFEGSKGWGCAPDSNGQLPAICGEGNQGLPGSAVLRSAAAGRGWREPWHGRARARPAAGALRQLSGSQPCPATDGPSVPLPRSPTARAGTTRS